MEHESFCNLLHPATLGTDEDFCDCGASEHNVSQTNLVEVAV